MKLFNFSRFNAFFECLLQNFNYESASEFEGRVTKFSHTCLKMFVLKGVLCRPKRASESKWMRLSFLFFFLQKVLMWTLQCWNTNICNTSLIYMDTCKVTNQNYVPFLKAVTTNGVFTIRTMFQNLLLLTLLFFLNDADGSLISRHG